MFRYLQHSYSLRRGGRFAFYLACVAVLLTFLPPLAAQAQPTGYQEYYVLGYEEHVWRAFRAINDDPDPQELLNGNICSTVSMVATADYQVVYYDHWEDGYEADLLNPTQSTTEIYGDGDTSNGGSGDDILLAGDDISLTSDQGTGGAMALTASVPVSPTRDSSYIRYDGGDRIITSGGPVDLTHAMWPLGASWIGGAWEVYSRQAYAGAFSYHLPIGEDLYTFGGGDTGTYGDFRNVYLQLGVFEDNTTVSIENGSQKINLTLNRGQTYFSRGYINSTPAPTITVNSGTVIRSNKPTQVGLITGADGSFQGRFLIILPDQEWGADYVVPVPRGIGQGNNDSHTDAPAEIYLSNPNDFQIEIHAYDAVTQTTFVISPTGFISATVPYFTKRGNSYVPQDSAARFISSDGVFGVVACADTSGIDYDWGFAGVPAQYLTSDYYVPWAPGNYYCPDDTHCTTYSNGSPVWVTPLANDTTFYVDYSPLDGLVDQTFTLDVLAQRRISDTVDNDNTGMHIWATDKFAIAWGEDPRTAGASNPYLDLGFSVLPLQQRWLDPVLTLDKTADPTILPQAGGSVTFTLVAQAYGAPLVNVDITDTLPISWTYVPGSSHVIYGDGSSGTPSPTPDGQTLFWDLSADLDLEQSLTLTFQAQITNTSGISVSVNRGEAIGKHEYSDALFNPTASAAVYINPLYLTKSVSSRYAEIGDTLVYTLSYVNRSASITATGVALRDVLPVQQVTFHSASDGGGYDPASGAVTWTVGTLGPGSGGAVTVSVTINSFVEDGLAIENVGYISSQGTATAGSNAVHTTVRSPNVEFIKSGPTAAGRGEVITYTLSYENAGGAAAMGVTISDTIPLFTTYVTGSLSLNTGSGWVSLTDAPDGDRGAYISPTLVITPGTVAAGEEGQIRFSVQIGNGLPSGSSILNSATLERALDIPRESNLAVTRISDLLLSKAAQQEIVAPGGVISYTLTYENSSNTLTQTNVYVREPIPDYTSFLTVTETGGDAVEYSWDHGASWSATLPVTPVTHIRWYDAQVSPNTQVTVGLTVRVNDALPPDTTIQNMAHISSTESAAYLGWVPSNQVEVATVDLWVEKSAGQPTARAGDTITYTISYGNHGSAGVAGVRLTDTIPLSTIYVTGSIWGTGADDSGSPTLSWDVMTVTAGASAQQVGYAVVLDSGLPDGAIVTNTAALGSVYGVQASEPVTVTVTIVAADLALSQTGFPDPVFAGAALTYTLLYTNAGPLDAQDVYITDTLPLSVTYGGVVEATPPLSGPTQAGRLLTWYTPTLATGAAGRVIFTVTVSSDAVGNITNSVTITSSTPDPVPEDNSADKAVSINTSTGITKSAVDLNGAPLYPGDEIAYRVAVTNTTAQEQHNVVVVDSAPANTTLAADSATCTAGALCWTVGGIAGRLLGPNDFGGMAVATIDNLSPGQVLTLTFRVRVNDNVSAVGGNVAVTESDDQDTQESDPVYPPGGGTVEPGLIIAKRAVSLNGTLETGDTIEYRIAVTNTNTTWEQTNVIISDTAPVNTTLATGSVTCSPGASCNEGGGILTATADSLAPGGAFTLTFRVTVDGDVSSTGVNVAAVESDNQNEQVTGPVYPPGGIDTHIYLPLIMRNYRARR